MKQVSRRLFLRLASMAPFAAKDAAAKQAGVLLPIDGQPYVGPPMSYEDDNSLKMIRLAKTGLMPDWYKRDQLKYARENARRLDVDLASMRSVSVSAKLAIQTQRNLERAQRNLLQDLLDDRARGIFYGYIRPKKQDAN